MPTSKKNPVFTGAKETNGKPSGIVFDSFDKAIEALKVFNGEDIGRATTNRLVSDTGESSGGMGAGLALMGVAIMRGRNASFVDRMAAEAQERDKRVTSGSIYQRSFDYDASGTSFFKATVSIEKVEGKYVIEICQAYVGDEGEAKLAQRLGAPRATRTPDGKLAL